MTNPISVIASTPLDPTRASSQQEPLGSQDAGGKSSDQQLEGEFGALLAQMVLGAAVQAPIAVTGGIGVQPEVKEPAGNSSEIQTKSLSDKSPAMPFMLTAPSPLQQKATGTATGEQIENPAAATKIISLLPTEKASREQSEQTDEAKVVDVANLPTNNLRKSAGLDKGKIAIQEFKPILQVDIEMKAQNLSEKVADSVIKNLPVSSKEKVALQQNSIVMEPQSPQTLSRKLNVERTNEVKVSEVKIVAPVVVPNPDSSVVPDVKKDFLKPAQVIAQTQIQSNTETIKENHSEGEDGGNTQNKESQSKSTSSAKAVEPSVAREIAVKPTNASQGSRGTYQQFAQMSSEYVTAKNAERIVAEQLAPLTPELSKSIIDQIAKEMTFRMKDSMSEIRVSLKPESLGEVVVNMQMEESKITAQINVDQSNVKAAVESQLPQLKQTLAERGIEIHRIDVLVADQSLARESRDQQSGKSKKRNDEFLTGIEEHDINYSPRSLGYNTIELLI